MLGCEDYEIFLSSFSCVLATAACYHPIRNALDLVCIFKQQHHVNAYLRY